MIARRSGIFGMTAPARLLLFLSLSIIACDRSPKVGHAPTLAGEIDAITDPSARIDAEPEEPLHAEGPAENWQRLSGKVVIDGSSTVFPITEAVASSFERRAPGVAIHLGVSGTGGGFRKFCAGQTDISDASRPINAAEKAACQRRRVDFIEVPIAFDGVSVVVHRDNNWVDCLTVEELRRLWQPESEDRLLRWSQLRQGWPDMSIRLYAPGRDSGTLDYFSEVILGDQGPSRSDFVASEDDYLLAQDIASDPGSLGFFGYAYYREYQDRLRLMAIDAGEGCVLPTAATIAEASYRPLSRPIFFYLSATSLARPEVAAFVEHYLASAEVWIEQVKYVSLPPQAYPRLWSKIQSRQLGSAFDGVASSADNWLEIGGSP